MNEPKKLVEFDFLGVELEVYVDKNERFLFHAKTVCEILELKNTTLAVQRHVRPNHRLQIAVGVGMPAWYITEVGLFQLAMRSKTLNSIMFQDWLYESVLPSIRKHGGYIDPTANEKQLLSLNLEISSKLAEIENLKRDIEKLRDNNGQLAQENRDYRLATCNALHAISTDGSIDEARASKMRAELSKALR